MAAGLSSAGDRRSLSLADTLTSASVAIFPQGAMTSLDIDAGLQVPAAHPFPAGNAYVFSRAMQLNEASQAPAGAVDEASCR